MTCLPALENSRNILCCLQVRPRHNLHTVFLEDRSGGTLDAFLSHQKDIYAVPSQKNRDVNVTAR